MPAIVEIEFDQAPDRGFGIEIGQFQGAFASAQVLINAFQSRKIETLLAAEIVIDHPLVDARTAGDFVDPAAGKALARKLVLRG
jgi:hypothetical protein